MLKEAVSSFTESYKSKSKKGTGHIEMIMGFTFFVGTVLFLFFLIRVDSGSLEAPSSLLVDLEENFKEMTESSVVSFLVKLDSPAPSDCVSIDLSAYHFNTSFNATSIYDSEFDSDTLLINNPTVHAFQVSLGEGFIEEGLTGCVPPTSFELGPLREEKYMSLEKMQEFALNYNSNYNSLKAGMGIGALYDFSIESTSGALSLSRPMSDNVNIYVSRSKMLVLNQSGQVENMEVVFKIW